MSSVEVVPESMNFRLESFRVPVACLSGQNLQPYLDLEKENIKEGSRIIGLADLSIS